MTLTDWREKIRFISNFPKKKNAALRLIHKSICNEMNFLNNAGLQGNLQSYLLRMSISISEEPSFFIVNLSSLSGKGRGFSFNVNKKTGSLDRESLIIRGIVTENVERAPIINHPNQNRCEQLEGKYLAQNDNVTYSLYLPGPHTGNGRYQYGDFFLLTRDTRHEGGGEIQEIISGNWQISENQLILIGVDLEQGSSDENGEAEGEAFIEPYQGDPIIMNVDLSEEQPALRGIIFDGEIHLTKKV